MLDINIQIGQPHATVTKTGTNAVDPDHIHIIKDITATVAVIPTEAILGHATGTTDDITEATHDAHTQSTYIQHSHHGTTHRRSSSHRSSSAYSQDHSRSCSQSMHRPAKKTLHQNSSNSRRSQGNTHTRRNSGVTIDDPQPDFYS